MKSIETEAVEKILHIIEHGDWKRISVSPITYKYENFTIEEKGCRIQKISYLGENIDFIWKYDTDDIWKSNKNRMRELEYEAVRKERDLKRHFLINRINEEVKI